MNDERSLKLRDLLHRMKGLLARYALRVRESSGRPTNKISWLGNVKITSPSMILLFLVAILVTTLLRNILVSLFLLGVLSHAFGIWLAVLASTFSSTVFGSVMSHLHQQH